MNSTPSNSGGTGAARGCVFNSAQMRKTVVRRHFMLVGADGGIDDVDRTCK